MQTNYQLDRNKRVWVEQPVEDTPELATYLEQIQGLIPGFALYPPQKRQVTILHIGKPLHLYLELTAAGARLSFEAFAQLLQPVLREAVQAITDPVKVKTHDLAIFGPYDSPVLVARLTHDPNWLRHRDPALVALDDFLYYAGIAFPSKFVRRSRNLRFSTRDSFKPHITLGSVPPGTIIAGIEVPSIDITLGPTRICGVGQ